MRQFVPIDSFNALHKLKPMQRATLYMMTGSQELVFKTLVLDVFDKETFAINIPCQRMDSDEYKLPARGTCQIEIQHATGLYKMRVNVLRRVSDNVNEWALRITPPVRKAQERQFFRVPVRIHTRAWVLTRETSLKDESVSWTPKTPSHPVFILDASASGLKVDLGDLCVSKGQRIQFDMGFLQIPELLMLSGVIVRFEGEESSDDKKAGVAFVDTSERETNLLLDWLFDLQRRHLHRRHIEEHDGI